jgi:nicotinamide mononucleotide transporter
MIEWLNNNWVEVVGASLSFLYLILEIKQNWIMWIIGVISSAFYVYIFFGAKLYAEMGLNFYYVFMSFYGLYCWKFARTKNDENSILHFISTKLAIILMAISFGILALMVIILIQYTDSPLPVPDALVATLGIVATWMTAKKIVECWYLWIVANIFAIGLYTYQALYPTAILYVFYSALSVLGLIEWRKSVIQTK